MRTLILILIAIISYVLGSINGAIIAGRFVFHKDVRRYGSGNAGLTNYYRAFGTPGIILLVLIDVLKTVVACLIGAALMKKYDAREVGILYVSLGSVVGSALCPVYLWIFGHEKLSIILGALCALLIIIKHAENIVRLISGRERKIDLGGRPKQRDEDDFVDP